MLVLFSVEAGRHGADGDEASQHGGGRTLYVAQR